MRLRYKASVVIACFAVFYVGITPSESPVSILPITAPF